MYLIVVFKPPPNTIYHQNSKPSSIIFRQKCTFSHICHLKKPIIFFFVCFVSIFLNLGFACFNRKLTQVKGEKNNLSCKRESPEVLLVLSDKLRLFFHCLCHLPRKKTRIYCLVFFRIFRVFLEVYNLI